MARPRRWVAAFALLGVVAAACGDDTSEPEATNTEVWVAAQILCPVMWEWVTDMGSLFNEAAADVRDITTPRDRWRRWMRALDAMERRNSAMLADVVLYRDDPVLAPLVAEIERDVPLSNREITDIRLLYDETPQLDELGAPARTAQVALRVEKVIDLPKPALGPLDPQRQVIPVFATVPSCQHAIKDVDDGRIQVNP